MPKNLNQLRSGKEFVSYAEKKEQRLGKEKEAIRLLNMRAKALLSPYILEIWVKD